MPPISYVAMCITQTLTTCMRLHTQKACSIEQSLVIPATQAMRAGKKVYHKHRLGRPADATGIMKNPKSLGVDLTQDI